MVLHNKMICNRTTDATRTIGLLDKRTGGQVAYRVADMVDRRMDGHGGMANG